MLRRALAAVVLALAAAGACLGQTNTDAAQQELNQGARAYRDGQFAEAEQHFRRALELDPENKSTRIFIARAAQQQYKPGDTSPENVALAERAVAAYAELLGDEKVGEDAYTATVFLYGQLKREDKVAEMAMQHAEDPNVPAAKRAAAYVTLAAKQWNCSYEITERGENKTTERRPDKLIIRYRKPADESDFVKARTCADEGLRLSELALTLDPENANGWSLKANLFREEVKLAEMGGDAALKEEYERRYEEAAGNLKRLGATERPGEITAAVSEPTPSPRPAEPGAKKTTLPGGVLNSKALSKPSPAYPVKAYNAHATGTVAVRVVVDETGKVVEAEAVSGSLLLREAAAAAARQARFAPTRLAGEPVKVSGILTYNFALP
ncbi:MAG: TonB family protein [Pyrinomonadaceae bacterium]